jgi:WD40 repeat protein
LWSPSNRFIALASSVGVWLYDVNNLSTSPTLLRSEYGSITYLAFDATGDILATGSNDGVIEIWDIETLSKLASVEQGNGVITALYFTLDHSKLYSGTSGGFVHVLDISSPISPSEIATFSTHFSIESIFSDVIALQYDSAIALSQIDLSTETFTNPVPIPSPEYFTVKSIFSPNGRLLASSGGGEYSGTYLWNTEINTYAVINPYIPSSNVVFSLDTEFVATTGNENQIYIWSIDLAFQQGSISSNEAIVTLYGHTDGIKRLAFSPDGEQLVSVSRDRTIRLWSTTTGEEQLRLNLAGSEYVSQLAFTPSGETLFSGDSQVYRWSVSYALEVGIASEAQMLHPIDAESTVVGMALNFDGITLAVFNVDNDTNGTLRLWNVETDSEIRTLQPGVRQAAFGRFLPIRNIDFYGDLVAQPQWNFVILWDATTGVELGQLEGHENVVESVAFSPDGSLLASASRDATVRFWDVATRTEVMFFDTQTSVVSYATVTFSPDGSLIAVANDATIQLWDVATRTQIAILSGHTSEVTDLAFNPEGSLLLASSSVDDTVRVWDMTSYETATVLTGHTADVNSVAFSPDGRILASGSSDGTTRLWGNFED